MLVLGLAAALRGVFPTADPPWQTSVGVVWHDEGAWVHNARNKALFGSWRLDEWNPLFIAPVFTGLEYLSFERSAWACARHDWFPRSRCRSPCCCSASASGGSRAICAGMLAGGLLATNYVYVMYNRAAIMEALDDGAHRRHPGTARTRSTDRPRLGALAGLLCASLGVLHEGGGRVLSSVRWALPRFSVWWSARTRQRSTGAGDRQAA